MSETPKNPEIYRLRGNLEFLVRPDLDDDRRLAFLSDAQRAAWRGADLTQRLLSYARRQPLRLKTTCLSDFVDDLAGMVQRTLGETIVVRTELTRPPWLADMDPAQLENALINLAINARHAMPEGGTLVIATANVRIDADDPIEGDEVAAGDYVMLSVTDSGEGMPDAVLRRATEPFFTTKDVGQGSGLGLSMVQGFASQSGGALRITSAVGRGTTVTIYLPRSVAVAGEAAGKIGECSTGW